MAKGGRRDGPGAAGSGVPAKTLLDLRSPKKEAEADAALLAWAQAELAPYLKIANENQGAIVALVAENQEWLKDIQRLNEAQFEVIYENVNLIPEYNHREATRDKVHQLQRAVGTLNATLSDAPGRLAQAIRNLTVEQVKGCPPDGRGTVGLKTWTEAPGASPNSNLRSQFHDLKEQIEFLVTQIESKLCVPRPRSQEEV